MRIYELLSGEPTPEQTEPLGPQNPTPRLASLPQPAPNKATTPGDAPQAPPKPGDEAQVAGMPTMYVSWGANNQGMQNWPNAYGGSSPQGSMISPQDSPDPRFNAGGVANDNQMMRLVQPK